MGDIVELNPLDYLTLDELIDIYEASETVGQLKIIEHELERRERLGIINISWDDYES